MDSVNGKYPFEKIVSDENKGNYLKGEKGPARGK